MKKKRTITGSVQLKNGKWWVVVNLYDENDKRKPKWIDTGLPERGNKRNAEKLLSDYLSEYNKKNICYSTMLVSDYFQQWLKEIKLEVRPNTYRSYVGNMTNHIIPYFENTGIQLQELTPLDLEDYYKSKYQTNSKLTVNQPLSPMTIKHHHQNISKALSDAVRKGLLVTNPASNARTPKAEQFKAEFLNQKEVNDLLLLFKGSVVELPVKLCAIYGLRRSEVLGLKWNALDFEKKSITVRETLQQNTGGDYTDSTKNSSSYRTLPMTQEVYEMLYNKKEEVDRTKQLMGGYYIDSDYVCTWKDGRVISPNYLTKTFHSIVSKSTLPNIRLHDLRHSSASNLLDMGFSVVQVADWLGHSTSTTTLAFYAHAEKKSKLDIAKALENQFK